MGLVLKINFSNMGRKIDFGSAMQQMGIRETGKREEETAGVQEGRVTAVRGDQIIIDNGRITLKKAEHSIAVKNPDQSINFMHAQPGTPKSPVVGDDVRFLRTMRGNPWIIKGEERSR